MKKWIAALLAAAMMLAVFPAALAEAPGAQEIIDAFPGYSQDNSWLMPKGGDGEAVDGITEDGVCVFGMVAETEDVALYELVINPLDRPWPNTITVRTLSGEGGTEFVIHFKDEVVGGEKAVPVMCSATRGTALSELVPAIEAAEGRVEIVLHNDDIREDKVVRLNDSQYRLIEQTYAYYLSLYDKKASDTFAAVEGIMEGGMPYTVTVRDYTPPAPTEEAPPAPEPTPEPQSKGVRDYTGFMNDVLGRYMASRFPEVAREGDGADEHLLHLIQMGNLDMNIAELNSAVIALGDEDNIFETLDGLLVDADPSRVTHGKAFSAAANSDYYQALLRDDGTADILAYFGEGGNIEVPAELDGHSVARVTEGAFKECSGLTGVTLPEGLVEIGPRAFKGCLALNHVDIPDSVTMIGAEAFSGCHALTEVKLPASLRAIGEDAFNMCFRLEAIDIPEGVTEIGAYAFMVCGFNRVSLPSTLQTLGDGAFFGCDSLAAIELPDALTEIGVNPFADCRALREIKVSDDHPALRVIGGVLFDKAGTRLISFPVGLNATSYTVPEGVEVINAQAFSNCETLETVELPASLREIGVGAFRWCKGLRSIDIPEGVAIIDRLVFESCTSLERVGLPGSVKEIGYNAFAECESLKEITLSEGLEHIGDRAFSRSGLTEIALPASVAVLEENPFEGCAALRSFTVADDHPALMVDGDLLIHRSDMRVVAWAGGEASACRVPDGVRAIAPYAFSGYENLAEIQLPDGLEAIGDYAFFGCRGLAAVEIPYGTTALGEDAFGYCEGLAQAAVPETVTEFGDHVFENCDVLTVTVARGSAAEAYCAQEGISCTAVESLAPTPTPEPTPEPLADLKKGDSGNGVEQLQQKLVELSYLSPDFVTGEYEDMTELAVLAFQLDHGFEGTGAADVATQEAIFGQ